MSAINTRDTIKLTPKAMEKFKQDKAAYIEKLVNYEQKIDKLLESGQCEEQILAKSYAEFTKVVHEFDSFLTNTKTEESRVEQAKLKKVTRDMESKINEHVKRTKVQTEKSHRSSVRSTTSSSLARMEAAKMKAEYARQEAKLQIEQARVEEEQAIATAAARRRQTEINAEMSVLQQQKEADIMRVEAEADDMSHYSNASIASSEKNKRTAQYIAEQAFDNQKTSNQPAKPEEPAPSTTFDWSKHIMRKELLTSRLTSFTDKPEEYITWQTSFKSIMTELEVKPLEELDFLVRWLGPESSRQARNIRSANIRNPTCALQKVWERLDRRYGCPEMIEGALRKKLQDFPSIKDNKKLYDLADILYEVQACKQDPMYSNIFAYFDSYVGVNPIIQKLPNNLREKWVSRMGRYKKQHSVAFPPFSEVVDFIDEVSKTKNDPSMCYDNPSTPLSTSIPCNSNINKNHHERTHVSRQPVVTRKTDTKNIDPCPIHNTYHELVNCRAFREYKPEERQQLLRDKGICFKCCRSKEHKARNCPETIKCEICNSTRHCTALHIILNPRSRSFEPRQSNMPHAGETNVNSNCTRVCNRGLGRSCSKTLLANVHRQGYPQEAVKMYVILDDQSNRTLARSEFFELFSQSNSTEVNYTLSSCSGTFQTSGRTIEEGLVISSLDRSWEVELPPVLECNDIPNAPDEIPTPEIVARHNHLSDIYIPELEEAKILLLVGRDLPEAHHVLEQRIGPKKSPYGQKLRLGWVVVGEACLDKLHPPSYKDIVNVNKTFILKNGRPTIFHPCRSEKEVFQQTDVDNVKGMSREDGAFMELMGEEFQRNEEGFWTAPLPFRQDRKRLPNNRPVALKRAKLLDMSLQKNAVKKEHFQKFMKGILDNQYAEEAPALSQDEECWYLPIFGVYHPQKKDQIRGVFDSSAMYEGVSLNSVLMSGPDLTNSLLGVLLRFRHKPVAVTADIEQMFYRFKVREDHRNYLRFLWYKDNDFQNELVEYRMTVHVFGNSPSPAVANYGLKQVAEMSSKTYGEDVRRFIERGFYVDDGLVAKDTPEEAIDLMKATQQSMQTNGNIRLHKIASNNIEVMQAFPNEDLTKTLREVTIGQELLPNQMCLGLVWDLNRDMFTFRQVSEAKPSTKRSMLSLINSIYDPLGILAPVTIQGKILMRDITAKSTNWDEPVPDDDQEKFKIWCNTLSSLKEITVNRVYATIPEADVARRELLIYSDASEKAISAVAYLKTSSTTDNTEIGFVMGKSKVAPQHGHTIPRLELCASVLAVQLYETIHTELEMRIDSVKFFTDSKVVLGYIHNQSRRFHVYVGNRVDRIRLSSKQNQWNYVPTHANPADNGTRVQTADSMTSSMWINGPPSPSTTPKTEEEFALVDPEADGEIRQEVVNMKTEVQMMALDTQRFEKFSDWKALLRAVAVLQHISLSFKSKTLCKGWHICGESTSVPALTHSQKFILKTVQREYYSEEISRLETMQAVPRSSQLQDLNPVLDSDGILRVGGRLNLSSIQDNQKNPVIVPGRSHVGLLLVRHYHDEVRHQGRLFTEGAIRAAGFWITSCKRIITTTIHNCVKCRRLRGKFEKQLMADLPPDRLEAAPAFSFVGVDAFGPWDVVSRKTRGGQANKKRWAIIFTCLVIRAIHIEIVEEMSSSSFINALRRFVAIRGNVKEFRSDCGTNFVGAIQDLGINAIRVEDGPVNNWLTEKGTVWKFNPPHASHFGGAWERMIGVARKIIDSLLADFGSRTLTHEVLVTFMAEVCCIVNSRPIVPVSVDPDCPEILSPDTLLTQKSDSSVSFYPDLDMKDMYRVQWKRVQALAESFWKRWRSEYLHTLQARRKWTKPSPNINVGDVVLLRDEEACRNQWPTGIIEDTFPSSDDRIRKLRVRVIKDGKATTYIRPVTEVVLLV